MREEFLGLSTQLRTARLCLRRLGEGHGQALYELVECQRERLRDSFPLTVESITCPQRGELAARRKLTEWYLEQSYSFGLWTLDDPRLIGYLSFKHIDWSVPKADMGYYIHAAREGQGLMSEALKRALQWGFEELRLARIYLRIAPENIASQKLAERCGFVREGLLRGDFSRGGVPQDMVYFGLTAGILKDSRSPTSGALAGLRSLLRV